MSSVLSVSEIRLNIMKIVALLTGKIQFELI